MDNQKTDLFHQMDFTRAFSADEIEAIGLRVNVFQVAHHHHRFMVTISSISIIILYFCLLEFLAFVISGISWKLFPEAIVFNMFFISCILLPALMVYPFIFSFIFDQGGSKTTHARVELSP